MANKHAKTATESVKFIQLNKFTAMIHINCDMWRTCISSLQISIRR